MSRLMVLQRRLPLLQIAAMVLLFIYGSATIQGFSASQSVRSMLVLAALLGIAALGQTLCVLIGGIDLSVPGLILVGAAGISQLCGTSGWPFLPAVVLLVVICAAVGAFTGYVCHRYRVAPLIVSLAVGTLAAGAMAVWTKGRASGTPPQFLTDLTAANGTTFGLEISPIVLIWAAIAVLLTLFLHRTISGRRLYATGANQRAAEFTLIRTRKTWTLVFLVSAVVSCIVGVLLAGFSGSNAGVGDPYLFQGLTAVIVGGTTFMGSRGDYMHTVVGALILTELSTILVGRGYETADQQIIFGVLILVVLAGYGRDRRFPDRI